MCVFDIFTLCFNFRIQGSSLDYGKVAEETMRAAPFEVLRRKATIAR